MHWTNLDYSLFDPVRRIDCNLKEVPRLVLPELMKVLTDFYNEVRIQRERSKAAPAKLKRRTHPSKKLKWTDPW
jgi:hypothetical protein